MSSCASCGTTIPDSSEFCTNCAREARPPGTIAGQRANWLFDDPEPPTNRKATISFVLGLFFFVLPCAFLAVVLGHLSLAEIKKSAGKFSGHGRAMIGLVLGYVGIALLPLIVIGAAVAIPSLLRARITANETAAIHLVQRVNLAELRYSQAHPDLGYTCNFSDLSAFGIPEASTDPMKRDIDNRGYSFVLETCGGDRGPNRTYRIAAAPVAVNATGARLFCSNESAVVKAASVRSSVEQCLGRGRPLN